MIAYLYAALSLRAAGRPVDDPQLRVITAALGLPVDEELFAAIARLATPATPVTVGKEIGESTTVGTPVVDEEGPRPTENGCYIYCVVPGGGSGSLGLIGLDAKEPYLICNRDLGAVVHRAGRPPAPSPQSAALHQRVVEAALQRFGAVVPLSFGHYMPGGEAAVSHWLEASYEALKEKLDKVRGKVEFGVQVMWDPEAVAARLLGLRQGLRRLKEEIQKNPGEAQEARQRLQAALEEEMRILADRYTRDYQEVLVGLATGVLPERLRQAGEGLQMIAHFSCLVPRENADRLALTIEERRRRDGLLVKLSGPWPPYSFVA